MQLVSRLFAIILTSSILNARSESVAEVLSSKGEFTVLLQALQAAGLDSAAALSGDANVTVFAPTDAAFTSLLEALGATAEDVLARDDLASILLFHVAVGQLTGDRLAPGAVVQSLEGGRLFAKLNENGTAVFVHDSRVLEANIPAGKAVIHSIDKVLLPPQRRLIDGGSAGWNEGQWEVVVDGVMGGKSSGNLEVSNGYVVFTGDINLDGGGFSSIRRDLTIDLSRHAGLMLEFDSHVYQAGKAPLGLHLQLGDSTSMWDFSAPFAIPFSLASERCRFFLPMNTFTHGSWNGRDCNNCELNYAAVNKLAVYVLFQEGPFEVRMYSIQAIERTLDAPLPTTPSVPLESNDITRLIEASISSGGSLYDKGYEGICLEIYAVALRQILAASGPSVAIKALTCAGLRMTMEGTNEKKAWALRRVMDAILADLGGQARKDNSAYPSYVQGDWLPAPGESGEEHICAGLADLSSSGGDSTAFVSENPNSAELGTGSMVGSGSLEGFLGPFEGMGISNWNDLSSYKNTSPEECARMCLDNAACRSFDYGARGKVRGECWLSTADREIAGDDYTSWGLYDYYEVKPVTTPSTSSTPATPCDSQVVKVLSENGNFATLLKALETAGLDKAPALCGAAEVTLFAPTDDAFGSLLNELGASAEDLLGRDDLATILLYHVAVGKITGSRAAAGTVVQTLEGGRFLATTSEDEKHVTVDGAKVSAADLSAGNAVIHGIDAVLLPPARRLLAGGSSGWDDSQWSVMGGASNGNMEVSDGSLLLTGTNAHGSTSAQIALPADLTGYVGLLIEFDAHVYEGIKAPLGLHIKIGNGASEFSAAFAVPMSSTPERCKVFLPMEAFSHSTMNGRMCSTCTMDATAVDSLAVYMHMQYQDKPFELRLHAISAVKEVMHASLPTAPSVYMEQRKVPSLINAAIMSGAHLWDSGYHLLCIEIYSTTLRQIMAATGPSDAVKAVGCAGLRMAKSGSDDVRGWALRKALDAIVADVGGKPRMGDHRYPSYVHGSWLPAAGESGPEGICTGLADLSSSLGDSSYSLESESMMADSREPEAMDDMKSSISNFLGPFEGMGITDWNDLQNFKNLSPKQCAQMCELEPKCRSFDYGARGMVKGECWLSTATRESVGNMYARWELYDYYERSADAGMPATAMSSEAGDDDDDDDKGPMMYILIGVCSVAGLAIGLAAACLYMKCKARRIPKTTINAAVVVGHPVYGQGVNNVQAGLPVDGDCGKSLEDPKICGA